jgi:L-lactate dehydrogenase
MQAKPKIALIGCRNVAPASAYSLLNGAVDIELLLIGEFADRLLVSVAELDSKAPRRNDSTVRVADPSELIDAKICVLSSGSPPEIGETEDSFLARNVAIITEKGKLLKQTGFNGFLVVTTNPPEIMAQAALEATGLNPTAVVGIGPSSIEGFKKTAEQNQPLVTWCSAAGCGADYIDSCHPDCPYFEDMLERFHQHQNSSKRDRPLTMASCVMRVCEAVIQDEKAVLPVAVMLNGQHAIMGTFTNVPCVIGKHGVERVLELPMSEVEHRYLLDAARENGRRYYQLTRRSFAASARAA